MSLRARLLLAFAYVLVLVIVALEVPLALNLSRRVDAEIKSEAQGQAQLLAAGAQGRLDDSTQLQALVESSAERDLGGRVIVVDEDGTLLADSADPGAAAADESHEPARYQQALNGEASQGERHSQELDEDLLFTAVPIVDDGRPEGAVRVTQGVDAVNREVRNDIIALIGVGVVALLLGLAVAWVLAGSLAKPLRGLAASARRVAGGDLYARAEVEGSSEQKEVRHGLQRHDRPPRTLAAGAGGVRGQRVSSAADPTHGPTVKARGRRRQDGRPGRARRARRRRARDGAPCAPARRAARRWRASASGPSRSLWTWATRPPPHSSAGDDRRAGAATSWWWTRDSRRRCAPRPRTWPR